MFKNVKKLLLVSLLAAASGALSTGCVALAVGAAAGGTVAYVSGELNVTYDHRLEAVHQAALAAVDDLGFVLVSDRGDRTGGEIIARNSLDKRIRIEMIPVADTVTEVSIRVGTFGDEDISLRVQEAIRGNL